MYYVWLVPAVIAFYAICAWLSVRSHSLGGWNTGALVFVGLFGSALWALVTRISTRLLFDAMLYDNLLFLAYAFTLIALGTGDKFTPPQWGGLGLIVVGSVVMRAC